MFEIGYKIFRVFVWCWLLFLVGWVYHAGGLNPAFMLAGMLVIAGQQGWFYGYRMGVRDSGGDL